MKSKLTKKALEALLVTIIIFMQFISVMWAQKASKRIDKIESSYVTQEQLDTTLIEVFD